MMKILQICAGPPFIGGGTRIYAGNLTLALLRKSYNVRYFYIGSWDLFYFTYLKKWITKDKIFVYEVRNSDLLTYNFKEPIRDINNPKLIKVFKRVLKEFKPDICHFQDQLNLSSDLIKVAKEFGAKTVVTHNNYWFFCTNTYLFFKNQEICPDPISGKLCHECGLSFNPIIKNIEKRSLIARLKSQIKDLLPSEFISKIKKENINNNKNSEMYYERKINKMVSNDTDKYNKRFNSNVNVLNEYVDLNIAVSNEVQNILVKYGIKKDKILVNHIGISASDFIKKKKYFGENNESLVLGYLGPVIPQKGALIILKALSLLSNTNIKLLIYGDGDVNYINKLNEYKRYVNFELKGAYKHNELNNIFEKIDIGIVPPIWYDNGPQVFYEMRAARLPVICSNVGGMKDFIRHGIDGFIYQYNDPKELAEMINNIYLNKKLLYEMAQRIIPPQNMTDHTNEIITIYKNLLDNS